MPYSKDWRIKFDLWTHIKAVIPRKVHKGFFKWMLEREKWLRALCVPNANGRFVCLRTILKGCRGWSSLFHEVQSGGQGKSRPLGCWELSLANGKWIIDHPIWMNEGEWTPTSPSHLYLDRILCPHNYFPGSRKIVNFFYCHSSIGEVLRFCIFKID